MSLIECRELGRTYRRGSEEIKPLENLDLDIDADIYIASEFDSDIDSWPGLSPADLLQNVIPTS